MLLVGLCWARPMDLAGQVPTAVRADTAGFFDKALDLFEFPINRAGLRKNAAAYPAKLVVAPIVSYAPETNWGLGVGAKLLFKFPRAGKETRTSNMPLTALYTLNNQLLLGSGYTLFFQPRTIPPQRQLTVLQISSVVLRRGQQYAGKK